MKTLLPLAFIFLCTSLFAQPACQWAYIPIGLTQSYNHIYNSTSDHSGNIIEVGMILGSGDMDPGTDPADTAYTNGGYNYYLSKTSPAGHLIWIHYFEENSQIATLEYAGLKINSANEIVVAGNYTGVIDFDFSDSGVDTLRSHFPTYSDYFVAKYDSAGNYKWAFNIGDPTTSNIEAKAITILSNDNIVVAANPNGIIDVDPGSGVHNSIGGNANLICYDSNGNYVWNNNILTSFSYSVLNNSLDGDLAGNVYVESVGYYELTINKFNSSGVQVDYIKLGQFSAGARVDPQSMLTDKSTGDIYVAGTFGGTVDFDPGAAVVNKISSSGFFQDGFIAKYDQNLNLLWVNAYPGEISFGNYCLDFDGSDIVTAGGMIGSIDFGNGIILSAPASTAPFYIKLNSSGISQSGYILDGYGQYITLSTGPNNSYVTTGNITGATDFDPTAYSLIIIPGASSSFTAYYQSPTPTSVNENIATKSLVAYPNPAKNAITLIVNSSLVNSFYSIFDITGKSTLTGEIKSENNTIKLDDLSPGIYFLRIGDSINDSIRFIKE